MIPHPLLIVHALHVQMEYYFKEQHDVQITDLARNLALPISLARANAIYKSLLYTMPRKKVQNRCTQMIISTHSS